MIFLLNPVDVIGVVFALAFTYPWALMLLPHERRSGLVLVITTLALSLGGLTLWMMALALVSALSFSAVVIGIMLVFVIGQVWLLRTQTPVTGEARLPVARRLQAAAQQRPLFVGAALVVIGIAALVTFNALYWPFSDDDAVSIYATQSLGIYQTGELPEGEGLYEAYPMLLPLSHVYSYMVAGEVDEYLARIAVAALGVGTLAATYALGCALYDAATGLSAAVLLALTPTFARWASSGYTDIPAAFFVTLAVLFAWWLYQHGGGREAFLLGVMTGLAAWTKNSALALAGSMAIWVIYVVYVCWQKRDSTAESAEHAEPRFLYTPALRSPRPLRLMFLVAMGLAVTAGPWYVRNLIVFGRIVPDTVWIDLAERTAANLLPFVTDFDHFFLPGIVFTLGIALAVVEALRRKAEARDPAALLLIGVVPFAAAWWWAASYETRFLLAVLPLVAVMGGHLVVRGGRWAWGTRPALPVGIQLVLVIALVALAIPAARKTVSFKGDIARRPLMGDVKRHRIAVGPIYDAASYLKTIPVTGRVLSDNYFLPFYVNEAGRVEVVVGGLPRRDILAQYDYLVYSAGRLPPDFVAPEDVELLIEQQGYRVYRVRYR